MSSGIVNSLAVAIQKDISTDSMAICKIHPSMHIKDKMAPAMLLAMAL